MIERIATYFPSKVLNNEQLVEIYPEWTVDSIMNKTGIIQRHVAAEGECSSDMAAAAARLVLERVDKKIDWLMFCTQTPDYLLPTSACAMQHRLGLPTSCAALDFNLGCSGYIYGLSMASALIQSGQAFNVLLLTADTYSKLIHHADKSTRTIFGDAGTATLLSNSSPTKLHSFVLGTDGRGECELIVRNSGARIDAKEAVGGERNPPPGFLHMNGPEIFNFTLKAVPKLVAEILHTSGLTMNQIDLVVFHQANGFMLEHLRNKLAIPVEKFVLHFAHCGNTVSSTIPVVLEYLIASGRLRRGMKVLLAGFGVGFSWGGCVMEY